MNFLALFVSLPTKESTGRMRVWRGLRSLGCGTLHDGVYVLPEAPEHAESLAAVAADVASLQGSAEVFHLRGRDDVQKASLRALFDRRADYAAFADELAVVRTELETLDGPTAQRRLLTLTRRLDQLLRIDFFPGDSQSQAIAQLDTLRQRITRKFSPDEPAAADSSIPRLDLADYRGRTWATRKRPWVDRLASAWLIRRHIDPESLFVWLDSPGDCRDDWLGFDFDGATFSHVGQKVTFETLLASFGLDREPTLDRLGALVHCLDVGGLPVADAAGVEALLSGLRTTVADDHQLFDEACKVFDWLTAGYQEKNNV